MYYTYIIRCSDDSLYTGIAADIEKRLAQHFGKTAQCAKYTRSHTALRLEAVWECSDRSAASRLEYSIKQLRKEKKQKLIDSGDMSVFNHALPMVYRKWTKEEVGKLR